jgi:hypothetical protein
VKVIERQPGGPTNIQSLRFSIRDDTPLRLRALGLAAKRRWGMRSNRRGLGLKVGVVIAAQTSR